MGREGGGGDMKVRVMVEMDTKFPGKVADFIATVTRWAEQSKPLKCTIKSNGSVVATLGEWKGSTP